MMNKKIIGIFVVMLLMVSSINAVGNIVFKKNQIGFYDCYKEKTELYANSIENSRIPNTLKQLTKSDYKTVRNNPIAIIETTMGTIKIELYKDLVLNTVDNFIKLTKDSFYDGLVFHRVINDFVIQGGGYYPNGTGKESPYGPIDLEIHPNARHVDGAIGMARTSDPNSATSQFYICDGPQPYLDDNYAVFGIVSAGSMHVVRAIAAVETTTKYGMQDWPVNDVIINSLSINAKSFDGGQELSPIADSLFFHPMDYNFKFLEQYPILFPLLQKLILLRFGL